MSFWLAVVAATAGNVIGSLIGYGVGATRLVERAPGGPVLMRRWEHMLDDREPRAVFVARLLPLARTFVSLPAGARRVPLAPFVALATIGCVLWAVAFVLIGLVSGTAWGAIISIFGKVRLGAVISWRGSGSVPHTATDSPRHKGALGPRLAPSGRM